MSLYHFSVETVRLQLSQTEKQRQDDLYSISTLIREKEALAKTDTRRLQEKVKDLFEEFNKQVGQRELKMKQDFDNRMADADKVIIW